MAKRPDDMIENHLAGRVAIGVYGADVPAKGIEKTMHLALSVMKPSGAGPAVAAAVNAFCAVLAINPAELRRQQRRRGFPTDRHERFRSAALVRTGAALEPTGPHHRLGDAGAMADAAGDVAEERGGVGIVA